MLSSCVTQDKNWAEALEEQRRVMSAHGPDLSMEALQSMEVPAATTFIDALNRSCTESRVWSRDVGNLECVPDVKLTIAVLHAVLHAPALWGLDHGFVHAAGAAPEYSGGAPPVPAAHHADALREGDIQRHRLQGPAVCHP